MHEYTGFIFLQPLRLRRQKRCLAESLLVGRLPLLRHLGPE